MCKKSGQNNLFSLYMGYAFARIAQLVEQGTENPCVAGSNPAPGTILLKPIDFFSVPHIFIEVHNINR
jgi:hypothetical protein